MDSLASMNTEHGGGTPIHDFFLYVQLKHVLGRQFTAGSCIVIPGPDLW